MIHQNYLRPYRIQDKIYFIVGVVIAALMLFFATLGMTDYIIFLILFYALNEALLHPRLIMIDKSKLTIVNTYFLGIVKWRYYIKRSKILDIHDISIVDYVTDTDADVSLFIWPGNGPVPFGLYKIEFIDDNGSQKSAKVRLYSNEYNILKL